MLATKVTNEDEEEVLEELEQLQREALGLPSVPIHQLPITEPGVEQDTRVPAGEEESQEERQAVLA